MTGKNRLQETIWKASLLGAFLGMVVVCSWAQSAAPETQTPAQVDPTVRELAQQVKELRSAIEEMRAEAAAYRAETAELRRELESSHSQNAGSSASQPQAAATPSENSNLENRVVALEESSQLLSGKVDEQYQTKVESGSKYKVRLSGIALLNLYSNHGAFDNADFPSYVPQPTPFNSGTSLGATLRQSELGLEIFGPRVAGARVSGNLQVDFSGGFPSTLNGANYGLLRLRTASMRMDWQNTSVVVGQDALFLSPNSPTSFASLAVPALGYEGNLWGWIPQVRVEHRFAIADDQDITVQAGLMDNITGEPPFVSYDRQKQAGESSGQPAFGARVAWTRKLFGQPLTFGTAGYYSRQRWGFDRHVDGWAGMFDWAVPLSERWSLNGEFYRGRAIGGLGGGIGRSTLYSGSIFDPTTRILGLDAVGGWSQIKFRATSKLEFNGALGLDNPMASDVRAFPLTVSYYDPTLVQNRAALINFVYHARSNLLFSSEYRRLQTFVVDNGNQSAGQVNLMMGVLF
jgi:regulator of replication initiation timing